jgi:protein-L-isoaspartate(D-aspartate) O-methyltransferase
LTARARRFPLAIEQVAPASRAMAPQRPQRPLADAAEHARRVHVPAGVGLDSAWVRARMVQRLHEAGLARHPAVAAALAAVPRDRYVDSALAPQAYEDTALPIGHGQTISKPSVIARMLELLLDGRAAASPPLGRVLEIGTGCGYQAALLATLARQVVSIERVRALHELARQRLATASGRGHIRLVWGDGRLGHPPLAPYDAIIAAAGGDELPPAWAEQLAPGGRLVAPVAAAGGQVLVVVERTAAGWVRHLHEAVQFVPLKSGTA